MQISRRVGGFQAGLDFVYEVGGDTAPCRMDMLMKPGIPLNTPHAHPQQEESFHVLSGTLEIKVGGRLHELYPGDELVLEPGTMHSLGNRRDVPALVYKEVSPGLDSMEFHRFLREMEEKKLGAMASTVEFAMLARRFRHHYSYPPLLSAYVRSLAAIGRLTPHITRRQRSS